MVNKHFTYSHNATPEPPSNPMRFKPSEKRLKNNNRRVALRLILRLADHGDMWAHFMGNALNAVEPVPVNGVIEKEAVYAVISDVLAEGLSFDGLVPVPGCDPREGGHGRYWLTGTVGDDVRVVRERQRFSKAGYRFLLTVGDLQFVGMGVTSRRRVKVRPGSRVTVECVFRLADRREWDADDLPEKWCSSWQVLGHAPRGELGYMVDLEPPPNDVVGAKPRQGGRCTPLLLHTDYGGGPLWYRSADNKAPFGLELSAFPLSEALQDRLVRWTAGDYHLHFDYEGDDAAHEEAWHNEGLALLAELRRELGPSYDIKYSHDLDA
ncbi:MAG TPA: hypothetical protein VF635_02460 [Propionibacteriaceae bacterium]